VLLRCYRNGVVIQTSIEVFVTIFVNKEIDDFILSNIMFTEGTNQNVEIRRKEENTWHLIYDLTIIKLYYNGILDKDNIQCLIFILLF
jgi:hypothetical protein